MAHSWLSQKYKNAYKNTNINDKKKATQWTNYKYINNNCRKYNDEYLNEITIICPWYIMQHSVSRKRPNFQMLSGWCVALGKEVMSDILNNVRVLFEHTNNKSTTTSVCMPYIVRHESRKDILLGSGNNNSSFFWNTFSFDSWSTNTVCVK